MRSIRNTVSHRVDRLGARAHTGLARFTRTVCAVVALAAGALTANAQGVQVPTSQWEFVAASGALIPTGEQRSVVKTGNFSTAQLSYVINSSLAITSTLGWARSREVAILGSHKFDAFMYDAGAEVRLPRFALGGSKTFLPFAGVGAGARSYNYRQLDVDAVHNVAAYGSIGGEFGVRRVKLRMEARDYVTRFRGLDGNRTSSARNDVVVTAGIRIAKR